MTIVMNAVLKNELKEHIDVCCEVPRPLEIGDYEVCQLLLKCGEKVGLRTYRIDLSTFYFLWKLLKAWHTDEHKEWDEIMGEAGFGKYAAYEVFTKVRNQCRKLEEPPYSDDIDNLPEPNEVEIIFYEV